MTICLFVNWSAKGHTERPFQGSGIKIRCRDHNHDGVNIKPPPNTLEIIALGVIHFGT